jgi:predicted phosphate transport protein (TIGR00153 family)
MNGNRKRDMFWKRLFRRRQRPDRFLKLICDQAGYAQAGLEALQAYVKAPSDASAATVRQVEKEADEVRRILIDELNKSFVTPIDREDLFALSRAIDDVLDYADTTVEEMVTLGVAPNQYLTRMVSLLRDAAEEINRGVQRLEDRPNVANDHAVRAKALENRVEGVYREAVGALFNGPRDLDHVVEMLKLREIYRHLSNAADRGDEAANIIGDIVVKQM